MERTADQPIVNTRLMIPNLRAGTIHRARLLAKIRAGLQKGFVLLSAPPGYGKTILLADWAETAGMPVVWLTLNEQDNQPRVFYRSCLKALQVALPDLDFLALEMDQGIVTGQTLILSITIFLNEIAESRPEIALVLDDFHLIHSAEVETALQFLLENLPAYFHVLISTRMDPHLPLARLRAQNLICEIRTEDLRFSASETRDFLNGTMNLSLTDDDAAFLEQRTEGWVAGLQLAALSIQPVGTSANPAGILRGGNIWVVDYLVDEVFHRQPLDIQTFLLRTSILDNLTDGLCDEVAGGEGESPLQSDLLHSLYHANLFLTALDREERWFRYHPLFAEALRRLLEEKMAEEIPALHRRASRWYASHGYAEEAINHALAAGDTAAAVVIIRRESKQTAVKGNFLSLLGWIRRLPEDVIAPSPDLCLLYAWGLTVSFEIDLAEQWVQRAVTCLSLPLSSCGNPLLSGAGDAEEEMRNLLGNIYSIQSILEAVHGRGEEALRLSKLALEYLPEDNQFSRSFVMLDQGLYYLINGEPHRALDIFQETIRISQNAGNWFVTMMARCYLGEAYTVLGQLTKAVGIYRKAIPLAVDPQGKPLGFLGYFYIELGEVLISRNEISEAESYITQGIALSKTWIPVLIELDGHLNLAYLRQIQGDQAGAAREMEQARQTANSTDIEIDDFMLGLFETRYSLLRGDLRQPLAWAQKNGLLKPDASPMTFPFGVGLQVKLNLARLKLHLGREEKSSIPLKEAQTLLEELLPDLKKRDYVSGELETLTLLALARSETGEVEGAMEALQQAFLLAEPEGYTRIFIDEGIPMARLITKFLSRQKREGHPYGLPTREYLVSLLRALGAPSAGLVQEGAGEAHIGPGENEILPIDLLTPRELEVLRMVAGGASNVDIARELTLSLNTVKRHLNNIFLKLGASTRTQAVSLARRFNILP